MIKVITDNGKTITAPTVEALKASIGEIFKADPRSDVTVTYVVTVQPTSRRMTPKTT